MFSASVTIEIGDGAFARFWTDAWLSEGAIRIFAPNLFAAVGRRRLHRSIKDALNDRCWVSDITGACTTPVICEYLHLWNVSCMLSYGHPCLTALFGVGLPMANTLSDPPTEPSSLDGQ
jgi:hypothetical protein